jgi:hypothetical protein
VYGYELVPEAVADARRNADRNGILNATFIQGDLNKLTGDFGKDFPKPDIVITGRIILYSYIVQWGIFPYLQQSDWFCISVGTYIFGVSVLLWFLLLQILIDRVCI